jgi:hypothetical protein
MSAMPGPATPIPAVTGWSHHATGRPQPRLPVVDHQATVEALARILETAGDPLQPGDRIIAGSIVQVPVGQAAT